MEHPPHPADQVATPVLRQLRPNERGYVVVLAPDKPGMQPQGMGHVPGRDPVDPAVVLQPQRRYRRRRDLGPAVHGDREVDAQEGFRGSGVG